MRAEELCKEAQRYDCYLHYERVGNNACIIPHGDYGDLMIVAATVLIQLEEEAQVSRLTVLSDLWRMMRKIKKQAALTQLGK